MYSTYLRVQNFAFLGPICRSIKPQYPQNSHFGVNKQKGQCYNQSTYICLLHAQQDLFQDNIYFKIILLLQSGCLSLSAKTVKGGGEGKYKFQQGPGSMNTLLDSITLFCQWYIAGVCDATNYYPLCISLFTFFIELWTQLNDKKGFSIFAKAVLSNPLHKLLHSIC